MANPVRPPSPIPMPHTRSPSAIGSTTGFLSLLSPRMQLIKINVAKNSTKNYVVDFEYLAKCNKYYAFLPLQFCLLIL
ncbi:MAG: hypothetical protein VB018_05065 [Lachnospiraceae bacterium]|nr:hypothetical protein [Lachnospiraceae bacterium]